ncbi:hypothetical protein ZIOFF_059084 [Zingiber officinale]|uniref:NPH3 domain-containing protein n=1 Tax=Zingiber officinale TaxID=94328 RepID=A0A8J5FAQ3_ZINOF|nr:hypothetical protein ZIOFF_059084 [Zingiber officinale]
MSLVEESDAVAEENINAVRFDVMPEGMEHAVTTVHTAEEVDLIDRIIVKIVNNSCKEQVAAGLLDLEQSSALDLTNWWGEALAALSSNLFQRVIKVMKAKKGTITRILMNYAQSSVQGGLSSEEQTLANQKIIVETIAGLLPTQRRKCDAPIAFLRGF